MSVVTWSQESQKGELNHGLARGGPVIGEAFAATGYVVKSLVDWWQVKRRERSGIIARLQDLKSLLLASGALFVIQQNQVKRLMALLKQNHPDEYAQGRGYDDTMARCHALFTEEEKALHGVIRAYTEHSMQQINKAMQRWIERDQDFKTRQVESSRREALADRLRELEMHLLLWHSKLEYWIPNQPHHALVYMADEMAHGLGFPGDHEIEVGGAKVSVDGLDTEVARVLEELGRKWK